jgi:hypothetical protein
MTRGSIPNDVIDKFFQLIQSLKLNYSPEVDSGSNRNVYQETSWRKSVAGT